MNVGSRKREFAVELGVEDQIRVHFYLRKGKMYKPTVQYETRVREVWRMVVRFDDAHGSFHRHVFNAQGEETSRIPVVVYDYIDEVTYAQQDIRRQWRSYKERFMLTF